MLTQDQASVEDILEIGKLLLDDGNYEQSSKCFEQAEAICRRQEAKCQYWKGILLQKKGSHNAATPCFDKAIQLFPKWMKPYHKKAISLKEQSQPTQALETIDKALELDNSDEHLFILKGELLIKQCRYNDAKQCFDQAVNTCTEIWGLPHCLKGECHFFKNEHDEALTKLNEAIEKDPTLSHAYYLKGRIYSERKRYTYAIENFNLATQLDDSCASYYYHKACALEQLESFPEALEAINKSFELDSDTPGSRGAIMKGRVLACLGQIEDAIGCYNGVLSNNPNDHCALCNKAEALRVSGRLEEALSSIDASLTIRENASNYNTKGVILEDMGRYDQALSLYGKAISLERNSSYYYNKGNCLMLQGKYELAIESFDQALEINPGFTAASTVRDRCAANMASRNIPERTCQGSSTGGRNYRPPFAYMRRGSNGNQEVRPPVAPREDSGSTLDQKLDFLRNKGCDVEADCPQSFVCPILLCVMTDPVVTQDGFSYERHAIEDWFQSSRKSPKTNETLPNTSVTPNKSLKSEIWTWVDNKIQSYS